MQNQNDTYYDYTKKQKNPHRLKALAWSAIALAVLSVAVFALAPTTAWFGKKVIDEPYDDGNLLFTGTLRAGKFEGEGKVVFEGGDSYQGDFEQGRFEGEGVFTSAEGWSFEGVFHAGAPSSGVFHTKNGDVTANEELGVFKQGETWSYSGALGAKGQRGMGVFTFANGAVYNGEFAAGMANGSGTYTDETGRQIYTGDWKAGLYEGEGEYTAPDGSFRYKGGFAAGKFEGAGTVTTKDGVTIAGEWKNGWRVKKS